jgi:hypothetical protein
VKSVFDILSCILNPEIVPLSVGLASKVRLHGQIICVLTYLNSSLKITTFESALKNQSIICRGLVLIYFIIGLQVIIVLINVVLEG